MCMKLAWTGNMACPYFPAWFTAWVCHMACESLPVSTSSRNCFSSGNPEARDPNCFGSRLQPAIPSPLTSRHEGQIHAFQRVSRLWGCLEHGGWWRGARRPSTGAFVESLGDHWGGVRDREVQTWETWGMKWELLAAAWGTERCDNYTIYIYVFMILYIYIIYIYIHDYIYIYVFMIIHIYIWIYLYIHII
jgi:hypothetical protein